ncbi:hypothetical protein [Aurantimonas coralicida]|uniref:hypothetical protein n=1 Tax=Aurantimonas coralicida TaxID=182270 RepID=UPI001D19639E|nr:hypothetical protein [Aurantimonas coralicida]MCC4298135.1 hypothetical protein [Aurantimonas coralicida]
MTVNEWAAFLCVPRSTLSRRLQRGYAPEHVFTDASHAQTRLITAFGQTHSISEWSRRQGIPARTLQNRIDHGEHPEQALTRPKQMAQVIRRDDKRLDGEHQKQVRRQKKAEREQAKADRKRQQAEQIARRNQIEIEHEGTDVLARTLAHLKEKREEERARIAAIKLIEQPSAPALGPLTPRKSRDHAYSPRFNGVADASDEGAGVDQSSAEASGTGVGSLARDMPELGFFQKRADKIAAETSDLS